MRLALISGLLALSFAGCATPPTIYQEAQSSRDMGWRTTKIESERYRVSFRANPDLSASEVENMALRRAAEVTLVEGYQWFLVSNRMTEQVGGYNNGGTSVGIGGSSGSYGSGVGVGIGFDLSPDSRRYETTLEILLGHGSKPADVNAYEARSVLESTAG
jgi:hypothetical protein